MPNSWLIDAPPPGLHWVLSLTTETDVPGVKQIAGFINESERRTHYLLEKGYIPAGQIGRIWHASKRTVRERYARVTGAA